MTYEGGWPKLFASAITVLGLAATGALPSRSAEIRTNRVSREMLCVTEGSLRETTGRRLAVDVPKMRGYVNRWTSQAVALQFTYLGPTANEAKLGSGETRRQFASSCAPRTLAI